MPFHLSNVSFWIQKLLDRYGYCSEEGSTMSLWPSTMQTTTSNLYHAGWGVRRVIGSMARVGCSGKGKMRSQSSVQKYENLLYLK